MTERALVACLLAVAACGRAAPPRPPPAPPAEDVRRLAAALDVVATDYARLDPGAPGHARLRGLLHAAEGFARQVAGAEAVRDVAALVEAHADAGQVATAARDLRRTILAAYGPIAVPVRQPSLARAQRLWALLCVGCHGTGGLGDGPQGLGLSPEPRSFRDPEVMRELSPLRAYSAITDGIPETAMPAWGTFSADERWGLAFLVFGLRHDPRAVERGGPAYARAGAPAASPTRLASLTDGEVVQALTARGLEPGAAADALAWLRVRAAFELGSSRLGPVRAEIAAALVHNRLTPDVAVADLDRARDRWREADPAVPAELRARCARALDRARDRAREGVLDEVLEQALREASACLDDGEERLPR